MTAPFDAAIFDLDGTLIDTESVSFAAGRAAFESLGVAVEDDFLLSLVGLDLPATDRRIEAHHRAIDLALLNARWREGFDRDIRRGLRLKPGAADLLDRLALPRAIATSSHRAAADLKLGLTGLDRRFDHVIVYEDVARAKPAPDPYLLAAARLGADPARCIAFEDSETGAEAAWRAGMRVVQVPDMVPTGGRFAHHVATGLIEGARMAGLIA